MPGADGNCRGGGSSKRMREESPLGVVPDSVIRPLLDHYVEFYFSRMAHEVRAYDDDDLKEQHSTINDAMAGCCYENVTPLLEATIRNDEASVFILLLHIKVNLLRAEEEDNSMRDDGNSTSTGNSHQQQQQQRRNYTLADYVNAKVLPTQLTPLHFACHHGNESIVRLLLEHNADHSLVDSKGWTPLAIAINSGHESIVNLLLDVADSREEGNNMSNPSYVTWRDLESRGETLLHLAVKRNDCSMARTLLRRGIDVNIMGGRCRKTVLHYACEIGNLNMIQLLVAQYDADVHIPERRDRRTPLHLVAAAASSLSCCEEDKVVDINPAASFDQNAMNIDNSGIRGDTATSSPSNVTTTRSLIAQLLIDHGSNVNERDRNGFTAIHLAIASDYEPPMYTPRIEDTDISYTKPIPVKDNLIQRLLQNGSDPAIPNEYGETALHRAAMEDNELSLRLILESYESDSRRGSQKTLINSQNNEGLTPLHCAVQLEHESIAKILLENYHANVNITEEQCHRTPLFLAVLLNNEALVRMLISNGASKTIPDNFDRTPWDIAATYGFDSIFPLLS